MSERHHAARPVRSPIGRDPSGPWVIDTRDVGRRPGSMRQYQRLIAAPAGFEIDGVIGVPEGTEVEFQARVESVVEGVLVSGTVKAEISGECSRCLEPLFDTLTVQVSELYAYPNSATDTSTEPGEVSRIVDELIDTEPLVRDAVLLGLPRAPLCSEDCAGLCPQCGGKRAELGPGHRHETIDPRWAVLAERLGDTEEENE